MPKKYNEREKAEALSYYDTLQEHRFVLMNDERITSVESLCKNLGLGVKTLYEWRNERDRKVAREQKAKEPSFHDVVMSDREIRDLVDDLVRTKMREHFFSTRNIQALCSTLGLSYGKRGESKEMYMVNIAYEFLKESGVVDVDKIKKNHKAHLERLKQK